MSHHSLLLPTNPIRPGLLPHEGEGPWLITEDGRRFLDMEAGVWSLSLGYSHPSLVGAIRDQAGRIIHTPSYLASREVLEAAEEVASIAPGPLKRSAWLCTGSETMDLALKVARAVTGRPRVLTLERSYMGATQGTFSVSDVGKRPGYAPNPYVSLLPLPDCPHCPAAPAARGQCEWKCLHDAAGQLAEKGCLDDVAAVVVEPVLASGGIIPLPHGYLDALHRLAAELGALLVINEVTTGLGRTGYWFAYQHEDVVPDMVVLAKTLGNGYPVACLLASEQVAGALPGDFWHVQSHQADPLGARVATTVIREYRRTNLIEHSRELGSWLEEAIRAGARTAQVPWECRGRGPMLAFQLFPGKGAGGPGGDMVIRIAEECMARGVLVGSVPSLRLIRFLPPLILDRGHVDLFSAVWAEALVSAGLA